MPGPTGRDFFEWEDAGGVTVVRFTTGVLRDDRIIRMLFEELERLLEQSGRKEVLMNFSGVQAFASYAIGKLISLNQKLQATGGRLALCCLTPIVNEIIDIMNLRKRFPIYATEQDALQSFE